MYWSRKQYSDYFIILYKTVLQGTNSEDVQELWAAVANGRTSQPSIP